MGVIKGVLKEELENSIRLKKSYEKALREHPGGCFVEKEIKGHKYYYLAFRDGKSVRFVYKGKKVSSADIAELEKSKRLREKYKRLVQKLAQRIKYLRKVLRGKEDV